MSLNPDSNRNVFSLMVDDWTSQWYHQKTKPERQQILSELRSYLKARRITEQETNPELSVIREKREKARQRATELETQYSECTTELRAWEARIEELESREHQEKVKAVKESRESEIIRYYQEQIAAGKIPQNRLQDGGYHQMIQPDHETRFGKDAPITAGMAIMKASKVIE